MREPTTWDVLQFCFWGGWRRSLAGRFAVLAAWGFALAIVGFNAVFRLLLEDGNLLIRAVCSVVLAAPLLGLYFRGKRLLR